MPATIDREPLSLPQTNLQLYNQLLCAGYPEAEIERVHAAYTVGEFGDGQPGSSDARRQQVRRAVGAEAEELVTRYTALAWSDRTVLRLRGMLSALSADDRAVILMRLANELEDHLDLGIAYCRDAEQRRQQIRGWLHVCVDLAEELR